MVEFFGKYMQRCLGKLLSVHVGVRERFRVPKSPSAWHAATSESNAFPAKPASRYILRKEHWEFVIFCRILGKGISPVVTLASNGPQFTLVFPMIGAPVYSPEYSFFMEAPERDPNSVVDSNVSVGLVPMRAYANSVAHLERFQK